MGDINEVVLNYFMFRDQGFPPCVAWRVACWYALPFAERERMQGRGGTAM